MNRASSNNYSIVTISIIALTLAIQLSIPNAFSDGNVDQQSGFDPSFNYFISFIERGQVFVPTVDNLIAIDVKLKGGEIVGDTLNITIHLGSDPSFLLLPGEDRIGTITSVDGETKHFDLDFPVALVPGQPYILELVSSNLEGTASSTDYPDGTSVFCNLVAETCGDAGFDLAFRTYFQPSILIGGTVGSLDTTTLLVAGAQANIGWWIIALVGVVAVVGIAYKAKTKKTHKETL